MRHLKLEITWRLLWYSTLTWILAFLVSDSVVLPWFYIILPLVILMMTVYYLDHWSKCKNKGEIFSAGLTLSIVWFLVVGVFNFVIIAKFYYFNFVFYFSDLRNWFLMALVLLVPFIYSLILENKRTKRRKKVSSRIARAVEAPALN